MLDTAENHGVIFFPVSDQAVADSSSEDHRHSNGNFLTVDTTDWPIEKIHDNQRLNPLQLDLTVTVWTSVPSYIILIISSVLIIYIVYKRYRAVLNVHFSVLFYIFCQLQFLIMTTASWIAESTAVEKNLCDADFAKRCKIKVLPGYAVLMITVVRTVFIARPLSYFDYIRRRYQLWGAGLSVLLCGLIASLPAMDIMPCHAKHNIILGDRMKVRYCSYGGQSCQIYFVILTGVGGVLPFAAVSCLYFYIYKMTVRARKVHEALTKSQNDQQIKAQSKASSSEKEGGGAGEIVNDKVSEERRRVPWSIIAILMVFLVSSTPWIILEIFKDQIKRMVMKHRAGARIFDVVYSLIQLSVGLSTLVYLLCTNSLRAVCSKLFNSIVCLNFKITPIIMKRMNVDRTNEGLQCNSP